MIITLIGYRGTGKTTIAPRLAQKLKFEWLDADIELERIAGRSIRDIFATDGEPEFRRLERENLVRLLKQDRLILATGGGAILNEATRRNLRDAGPVVWLKASVDSIAERILVDGGGFANRPNLTKGGGIDEIRAIVAQREPLYQECASISVPTDSQSIDAAVEQIVNQLPASYRQEMNA